MKTSQLLLAAASALAFTASPAQANELLLPFLDVPEQAVAPRHRGNNPPPAKGLQLSSGLQLSGPLNCSSIAVRLTEGEWRKVFPRKEPRR